MRWLGAIAFLAIGPGQAAAQVDLPLFDLLCGRTVHVYYGGGNQIEYLRADGHSFFWRYNSAEVIEGQWRIRVTDGVQDGICFDYEPGALGPFHSGEEFCLDGAWFVDQIGPGGLVEGDRYALQSGAAPFRLTDHPRLVAEDFARSFPEKPRDAACSALLS